MRKHKHKAIVLLAIAILLVGCTSGGTDNEVNSDTETPDIVSRHWRFPGSLLGGSFYLQSTAIASLLEEMPFIESITVEATTGGNENYILVNDGADIGLVNTQVAYHARNALEPFDKEYHNVASIAMGAASQLHIIASKEAGVKTFSDLKGKTISPGTRGSGTEMHFRYIIEALDMSYDDFSRVDYLTFAETVKMLQDGKIDAGVIATAYPAAQVLELSMQKNICLVPFSDEEIEKVNSKLVWPVADIIPGGNYEGIDEDTQVLSIPALLAVRKDIPEYEVYEITKAIHNNIDRLAKTHSAFELWDFSPEVDKFIPLHPGAKKYYEEIGK